MSGRSSLAITLALAVLAASCGGGGSEGGSNTGQAEAPSTAGSAPPLSPSRLFVSASGPAAQIASYTNAVFPSGALGADRSVTGPSTLLGASGVRGIAVDVSSDRLYAVNVDTNSILVFDNASTANGDLPPDRVIVGPNTLLDGPLFLCYDAPNDRLYVSNVGTSRRVLVFDAASTALGNVAPTREISGFTLQPFSQLAGVQLDPARNILYVADLNVGAIYAFDDADTVAGAIPASRVIAGAMTTLSVPRGVFLDPAADRLFVANLGGGGTVLVFDGVSAASGNIVPTRTFSIDRPVFQPSAVFLDAGKDRIYVVNGGVMELAYLDNASTATGLLASTALATLTGVSAAFDLFVDTR